MKCAVLNCHTGYKIKASECSLFSFPVDPVWRKKWIQFCRQSKEYDFKTSYMCMEHFAREDFENIIKFELGFAKKRILKRGAVPSIYKPSSTNSERLQRAQRRQNKEIVDEILLQSEDSTSHAGGICFEFISYEELEDGDDYHESTVEKKNSDTEANSMHTKIEALQEENLDLQKENDKLKSEITTLKREYSWKEKKHAYSVELLQKRALKAEQVCKNMEEKLAELFTGGQIEKLKKISLE